MIIYLPLTGEAQILTPEHIYQGSNNINEIEIISPLPNTTALTVSFRLPIGMDTLYYPTTYIGAITGTETYHWRYLLENTILQYAGTVSVSINSTSTAGNRTSYSCNFLVEPSSLPELPPAPSEDVYDDILLLLQDNSADIANILSSIFGVDIPLVFDQNIYPRLIAAESDIDTLQGQTATVDTRIAAAVSDHNISGTAHADIRQDIVDEQARAEAAEGTLGSRLTTAEGDINTEELARAAADGTLQGNIDAEALTRAAADTALGGRASDLETAVGTADISAIAADVKLALLSLNDDIESLQEGVVPRLNRGLIEYASPSTTPDSTLVALMDAFIYDAFTRTPDNTDKMTVADSGGEHEGTYYTYCYWKGYDTLTDGWYWSSISVSDPVTQVTTYTQNILLADWGTPDVNGIYTISITNSTHGQGSVKTLDFVVYAAREDGTYLPVNLAKINDSGTVTIETDETFTGFVTIAPADKLALIETVFTPTQIIGGTASRYLKDNGSVGGWEVPDSTPTAGSSKLVTSGGVFSSIDDRTKLKNFNETTIKFYGTADTSVVLPLALPISGSISPVINWGDGTTTNAVINYDDDNGNIAHTYSNTRAYQITITGDFNGFYANNTSSALRFVEVNIGTNATQIGDNSFYGCSNLEKVSINLGSSAINIGDNSFYGCSNLNTIYTVGSFRNIGDFAFYGCFRLKNIDTTGIQVIGNNAFDRCVSIIEIYLPRGTLSIGNEAFKDCSELQRLTIPYKSTAVTIGTNVFTSGGGGFVAPKFTDLIITGGATQVQAEALRDSLITAGLTLYTNYRLLY